MIGENPLLSWSIRTALREGSALGGLIVFGLLYYALILGTVFVWSISITPGPVPELLTLLHYETWAVNGLVLLLWSPTRLAQRLATERERGTLEMLRLTGLSGQQLAVGLLGGALALPVAIVGLTLPVLLLGAFGTGGPLAPLRAYPPLLLLTLCASLLGGLVGLGAKKAQNAGSSIVFLVMVMLALSGPYKVPGLAPLGVLGPWAPGLATVEQPPLFFEVPLLGGHAPGDLLQLPVLLVLAGALLHGLARRLAGEPAVLVGRTAAAAIGAALTVVAAVTLPDDVDRVPAQVAIAGRAIVVFLALLPLAIEAPVGWTDLVRGLARRGADDVPFPDERLGPARFAAGPALLGGAGLVMAMASGEARAVTIALLVALGAWLLAAMAVQACLLRSRDVGAPRVLAGVGLAALWLGPLLGAWGLRILEFPPGVAVTPLVLNPLFAIACAVAGAGGALPVDPASAALASAALHIFGALGLFTLVRNGLARAEEAASSMVVLPADADRPPGALSRRCENGHVFGTEWATCPHCPSAPAAAGSMPRLQESGP